MFTSVFSSLKSFTSGSKANTVSSCCTCTCSAVASAGPSCLMMPGPSSPTGTVTTQSRTTGGTASSASCSHSVSSSQLISATPAAYTPLVFLKSFSLLKKQSLLQPQLHNLTDGCSTSFLAFVRQICAEGDGHSVVELPRRQRFHCMPGISIVKQDR